jgi:alpha-ribazole phosphatase
VPTSHTTFDLVRHGEIATRGLLCASASEPLSADGYEQLQALKSGMYWDIILSSPYHRCAEFSAELAHHLQVQHIIDPAWQEIDFGSWTDVSRETIWASDRERLLQLWTDPLAFCAPDGESMMDFVSRIESAFRELLQAHQGASILVLTHAGVIRAILASALGIDYKSTQKFNIQHAKINRLRAYPEGEFSLLNWACSASEFL